MDEDPLRHYSIVAPLGDEGRAFEAKHRASGRPAVIVLGPADAPPSPVPPLLAARRPGLQAVLAVGRHEGRRCVVLEALAEPSLQSLLEAETPAAGADPFPVERVAEIGAQIAEALAALHAAGLAHGSLAPEQIRITPSGEATLCLQVPLGERGLAGAASTRARQEDVVALATLLQTLSSGPRPGSQGEAVRRLSRLLDEARGFHPTRPAPTARQLAAALRNLAQPLSRPLGGVGPQVLVVLALLLGVGLLAVRAGMMEEPSVRFSGRAPDPAAAGPGPGVLPRSESGAAGASSAPSGPEAVLGSWTCTIAGRPHQSPELRFAPDGQWHIQIDLKRGRARVCDGDWIVVGPARYRLTGACTVSGSTVASPFGAVFKRTGANLLVKGQPTDPNSWRCDRLG
ncbi:MAG: hypothetical protein NDJ94_15815 [Vicinamibacteria bacterium]|nr:hypothetical protein [Vicinamibacteria bacterium]